MNRFLTICCLILGLASANASAQGTLRFTPDAMKMNSSGAVILGSNSGGTGRAIPTIPTLIATGDGTTDDTAAFQAMAASGQSFIVPPAANYYKLTARIDLNSNQYVYGYGAKSKIVQTGSGGNGDIFRATGKSNVGVFNCYLTPGSTSNTTLGFAVSFVNCTSCRVEGCEVTGHINGIGLNGCSRCVVRDNFIHDSPTWGTGTYRSAADIHLLEDNSGNVVQGNRCFHGAGQGIAVFTLTATGTARTVRGNVISQNTIDGETAYGIVLYNSTNSASPVPDVWSDNLVAKNTVRNITGEMPNPGDGNSQSFGAGIYIQGARGTSVSDNAVAITNTATLVETLSPAGIGTANLRDVVIKGNRIEGGTWYGIMVADSGSLGALQEAPTIVGNEVYGCARHNIHIKDIPRATITGNTSNKSTQSGLVCRNASTSTSTAFNISGNTFNFNGVHGAVVSNGIANFTGNVCDSNASGGLSLGTPNRCIVVGNTLRRNAINLRLESGGPAAVIVRDNFFDTPTGSQHILNSVSGLGIKGAPDNIYLTPNYPLASSDTAFALADSATPAVGGAEFVKTGGTTGITDFTGGNIGQRLLIRADHAVTITHGSTIKLNGSANYAMTAGGTLTLILDGSVWRELGRSAP